MQRYHASSCTSAVNHNAIGGASARETARADSSSLPSNLSLSNRRPSPLIPYQLRCDKEPLNSRLGPPDFLPQTPNCPEESLTREYVQSGYRETVDGLEESREISSTQVQTFTKPLVVNCKDAIRKHLRAINESRAQKRKAGQVYGVPLSGSLLTKPGVFPDLRPCGEDFRKKWIEGLSQQHKRLRSLADNVPQGYRTGNLFEVLIRNNVPLLRATWFIKITFLNQVRPGSGSSDRTQFARTELWTKEIVDYLQSLLDDFFSKNSSHSTSHSRDPSIKMPYSGLSQHKGDVSAVVDSQGPTLHFKWWYMVRLLQWHQEEGLLLPSLIIDWVLSRLQEKKVLVALQFMLPIIYGVLETIIQSQTYVRILVRIAVQFISEPSPGGSDLVENSRRAYTISSLVEMLRYLILAVPDTFVALDCFPLPSCVTHPANDGNFASKASDDGGKMRYRMTEVSSLFKSKDLDNRYQSVSFGRVVSSIQKRADNLAKAAMPEYIGNSVAKVVETLDKSLVQGEISGVYKYLFEDFCDGAVNESWIKEVSPCLRSTMKWLRTVSLSFVSSAFFLCEWATCDFRDIRTAPSREMKFTGGEDFSYVYIAIRILKMKIMDLQSSYQHKNNNSVKVNTSLKPSTQQNNQSGMTSVGSLFEPKSHSKNMEGRSKNPSDMFKSPGPLHDIIVCWIDQHDVPKGKGFKRLQLLIFELIRAGIFYPHSYVRQLIVSGIMDTDGPAVDPDRRRRHHQILKQFPGNFLHDSLEEAKIAQGPQLLEIMHAYSSERRLVLRGLVYDQDNDFSSYASTSSNHKRRKHHSMAGKDSVSRASVNQLKAVHLSPNMLPSKNTKNHADIEELKVAISVLLQFPNGLSTSPYTISDESQGISAKRSFASIYSKFDCTVGTPGCEECMRAKKQKLSEERSSYLQAPSPLPLDEEDTWWVRKGPKSSESLKVEPQVKSTKIIPKSRQKGVRKTQTLAQLAAARIEGSQGASTSHVCDNKVNCPHHRTGADGETLKPVDWVRTSGDIVLVGKALKGLRLVEKSAIASWLIDFIRQLIEETEKSTAKAGQFGRAVIPVDERSLGWKLGEDELSAMLYFMDCCNDLVSAVKFLLWLLPRVLISANSTINSRRGSLIFPKNVENQVCEVGEAHLISSLRRYENILIATDLIPEALSSSINRATSILVSNGRVSSSAAMAYARYLLKKYNSVSRVIEWEKNFKATCDKRLLSELESGRSIDGEVGFPLGVQAGVEDPDDFFRQKLSGGRLSRVGVGMRDLVQRHVEEAFHNYFGKERKLFAGGPPKSSSLEKSDDGYQIAQQISTGIMECMRQTGGAAQEGDPSLVSSGVSAIVNSVGLTLSKIPDFISGTSSGSSTTGLLNFARRILHIHISCLCLLKEALGERQNRVFDMALAIEASSALSGFFPPGRPSSLAHDSNNNISSENMKIVGRATRIAAAVSALVIGAVVQGVTSLERLVSLFKLKEGLDFIQFVRNTRSNSNGNSRSTGAFKMDNGIEVYVHWFRVLIGNCRTVLDGSIVELLGEPSIVALSRMQRILPLTLVLPPAYSIFAFLVWRPFIPTSTFAAREDTNQFYHSLTMAMSDAIRHLPFRDVCLRDSLGFYDLVSADSSDVEFAAILDLNGSDLHAKSMAFVPLRARLFLNGLIDCKIPDSIDDGNNRISGFGDYKISYADSKTKLLARLVHVLDTLQPAKFHWQWLELRLLLNEQGLIDKLETHDISLANAIRSSSPSSEKAMASENENNFIEIILTRLLVRPDAAPLFSDVIHLFGRLLENSMLLHARWFLGGPDVLLGRKSIRQKLINIAESKGLSTKVQFWKPWGWYNTGSHATPSGDKKLEAFHLEEGEVVEEGVGDSGKSGKVGPTQTTESESFNLIQQYVTEKALIDLVLPCIDQSSEDSRNTFANDLIKQLSNIEQQISAITRGSSKQVGLAPSGIEGPTSKSGSRKGMKGGSPGLARRSAVGPVDSAPPTPAALKASLSLRLRLLLRLLPVIRADGEPSGRNMRHMLASVILRLLGSRVVHEDADVTLYPGNSVIFKEVESPSEASSAAFSDLSGESLFDRLLLVLHGLLSTSQPSWLKSKPTSKSTYEYNKDSIGLDRELAECLQNDLERIEMPETVRSRIQAAMPILLPPVWCPVSCPPPTVPISAFASLHPSIPVPGISPGNPSGPHGTKAPSSRAAANKNIKSKNLLVQPDYDTEIDPWILLEEGAGSGQSSSNSASIGGSDHANLKASSFLKGAVRVRRTVLMYIGVVDDES